MLSVLEVWRNGELTSGSEFCIGDNLTFTCNISNIVTYVWTVTGLVIGNDGTATVGFVATTREINGLTYTLVATSNGQSSVSTLNFTVSNLLNERSIVCGGVRISRTESQVVNILGMLC